MTLIKCTLFIVSLTLVPTLGAADKKMSEDKSKKLYELPQDCDFMQVGNNDGNRFDCSPRLMNRTTSPFRGLLINGPKEVVWPKNISRKDYIYYPTGDNNSPHRLMIAGLSKVPDSTLGLDGDVADSILVVAVNQQTAEAYSGMMIQTGFSGPKPSDFPGAISEDKAAVRTDHARKSYFNIDLVHNTGIPIADATYTVYATLGDYKSNVLTIKTTVK